MLTRAEEEVCRLVRLGMNPREIAQTRGVSVDTVRAQLKSIYAKLNVRGRCELAIALSERVASNSISKKA